MESVQKAFSHGLAVAAKIGYDVFQNAILNALFILDEEHLELAIEQDVDLLPLFLIYAPRWVQQTRQFVGKVRSGYEAKITLQNTLKWLKELCDKRHRRYYDIIVNLPKDQVAGSNPTPTYPPPGADEKRVLWYWNNVQRLSQFLFHGEMPESSKKWGIQHLKWLQQQKAEGKTSLDQLLESGVKGAKQQTEGPQN